MIDFYFKIKQSKLLNYMCVYVCVCVYAQSYVMNYVWMVFPLTI